MLILLRKTGEKIVINDDISITLLGIDKNRARIGIDAPKSIAIYREEIYEFEKNKKDKK